MNWQDIKPSADGTFFMCKGKRLITKQRFTEVLKFHSPGLAPVKDQTGAYHVTQDIEPLYGERYLRTFGFYCNRAAVVHENGWFHISEKGIKCYPQLYAWAGNFQENLCTVRDKKGKYFHIDLNGNKVYEKEYAYCGDYKDDVACVKCEDGLFRHIDPNGQLVHNNAFLDLGIFHKNYATAKDERGWHHIDKCGKELYQQRYLMVEPFYNGFALVTLFDSSKSVINENGSVVHQV